MLEDDFMKLNWESWILEVLDADVPGVLFVQRILEVIENHFLLVIPSVRAVAKQMVSVSTLETQSILS